MTVFLDTSVFVAAFVAAHEHHGRAFAAVQRVHKGLDVGYTACHVLAEVYATLSVLPVRPRLRPREVATIVQDNVCRHFRLLYLRPLDYRQVVQRLAEKDMIGGIVYDALIFQAAEKVDFDRFFTFNLDEFHQVAPHRARQIRKP